TLLNFIKKKERLSLAWNNLLSRNKLNLVDDRSWFKLGKTRLIDRRCFEINCEHMLKFFSTKRINAIGFSNLSRTSYDERCPERMSLPLLQEISKISTHIV